MPDINNTFSIFDDGDEESIVSAPSAAVSESDDEVIISDDVIAVIAGQAASSLDCVSAMSTGVAGDLVESLGVKRPTKGVLVKTDGENAEIDVYVTVKYGKKFADMAWEIQEAVKTSVENMTGVMVTAVNVHVQGVDFPDAKTGA